MEGTVNNAYRQCPMTLIRSRFEDNTITDLINELDSVRWSAQRIHLKVYPNDIQMDSGGPSNVNTLWMKAV